MSEIQNSYTVGLVHLSALWKGKINMKNSIKSSPKVTCHHHHSVLSNKHLLAEAGGKWKSLASWSDKHIPSSLAKLPFPLRSSSCSQNPDIVPLTGWPLALTLSQDCFSLKSLEDTSSQRLEDCAYLKWAGFLAERERGSGGREMNGKYCVSARELKQLCLDNAWCSGTANGWLIIPLVLSRLWNQGIFFHCCSQPQTPQSSLWKVKTTHKISMSIMTTISFICQMNEKIPGAVGYWGRGS